MPILDAFAQRGKIRFVMARGEAGASNMADACARSTASLGVCITSTGTGGRQRRGQPGRGATPPAPRCCTSPARSRRQYLDHDLSYIHEAPDQLTMLEAVSKAAFRVRSADTVPVHAQGRGAGRDDRAHRPGQRRNPDRHPAKRDRHAGRPLAAAGGRARTRAKPRSMRWPTRLAKARRPLLWLGGGARHAGAAVQRLQGPGLRRRHHRRRAAASCPKTTPPRWAPTTSKSPVESLLPDLRRHARRRLAPAQQRNAQVRAQAPAPAAAHRRRRRASRAAATSTTASSAATRRWRSPAWPTAWRRAATKPTPNSLTDLRKPHDEVVATPARRPRPLRRAGAASCRKWPAATSTGCATSPSPTAPGATANCASSNRSAGVHATGRRHRPWACRWPSARPSARPRPDRAARPCAWRATAASS